MTLCEHEWSEVDITGMGEQRRTVFDYCEDCGETLPPRDGGEFPPVCTCLPSEACTCEEAAA